MNNGGGDGHSSNNVRWRRSSFHQSLVSTRCDLASGVRKMRPILLE